MKKIALFGGSGRTGQELLKQALPKGYHIRALARTPDKIPQQDATLDIVKGDVMNPEDVAAVVAGTDLVVSLFGHVKGSPPDLQTTGTRHILQAMQQHNVQRILSLSGGGLPYPEKDQPKLPDYMIRGVMKLFFTQMLKDAVEHASVLRTSDRDWSIVRAPRLTDGEHTGEYRVGWVGVNAGTQLSRADLADFILREVEENRFTEEMPFVSY